MGGKYPSGSEFNFNIDGPAAQDVAVNWPTPIIFSGWEIGSNIYTGPRLCSETPTSNPVRAGYVRFPPNGQCSNRQSWDQTAVLVAVRGLSNYFNWVDTGYNDVDSAGNNQWRSSPDKDHSYLTQEMSWAGLEEVIENLMIQPPKST